MTDTEKQLTDIKEMVEKFIEYIERDDIELSQEDLDFMNNNEWEEFTQKVYFVYKKLKAEDMTIPLKLIRKSWFE